MAPAGESTNRDVLLRRTVRFAVQAPTPPTPSSTLPPAAAGSPSTPAKIHNSFAGHPAFAGLGRHYELIVACRGGVDPRTGYFLNIKAIDAACRKRAIPLIADAARLPAASPEADPATLLPNLITALDDELGGVLHSVRWMLTPYHSIEMAATPANPPTALMRQIFEFAAAHRLQVPGLSDEENRRLFGKCTNESGHGHNYKVEPCVAVPITAPGRPPAFTLADLERLTDETIIERFDHKHLNEDTEEFGPASDGKAGLNPSVENIAKVCHDLLAAAIARHNSGARLASITVWETDKTSCTYPA